MIINARLNNSPKSLAAHLMKEENETVSVYDGDGLWLSPSVSGDLRSSIQGIKDMAYDTEKPKYTGCYHIDINPTEAEIAHLKAKHGETWQTTLIRKTLSHFGLKGHPYLFVEHAKRGQMASLQVGKARTHFHTVVSTYHPEKRKQCNLYKDRYKWQIVSSRLEKEIGSTQTNRKCRAWQDKERTYIEKQIEDRTSADFTSQKRLIQEAWKQSKNDYEFTHLLASVGLALTYNSDKGRFAVIDAQNNPKALGQYLKGIAKASDIHSRLGDLIGQIPETDEILRRKLSSHDLDSLLKNSRYKIDTNFAQPDTQQKPQFNNAQRRKRKTKFFKKLLKKGFQSENVEPLKINNIYRINICDSLGKMYLHLKCGSIICNSLDRVELLGALNIGAVKTMVDCSQVNNWKAAKISGSDDFKIMITREYLRRGIQVTNFGLSPEQLSKFINEISSPDEVCKILATHFQMDKNDILNFINSQPENLLHELHQLKENGISIQDHLKRNSESYQREKIKYFVLTGEIDEHLPEDTKSILQEAKNNPDDMEFLQGCIPFINMDKWNELEGVNTLSKMQTQRQNEELNHDLKPTFYDQPSIKPNFIPSNPFQ